MEKKKRTIKETGTRFEKIVNKIILMGKYPRDYGTGELLHLAEIHTICAAGMNPGMNITELAGVLGITKGTLSPVVNKLEKKNYLVKMRDPYNGKNILVALTEKGKQAEKGFGKYREEFITEYAQEITDEEFAAFNNVLARLEAYIDSKIKEK